MNNTKCRIFTARGVLASTSRVEKFERVLVAILAKISILLNFYCPRCTDVRRGMKNSKQALDAI